MVHDARKNGTQLVELTEEAIPPEELLQLLAKRQRLQRNAEWLNRHADEVYTQHRGDFICIANEQVFAAASAEEALSQARRAHPEDDGSFALYIPLEAMPRVYRPSKRRGKVRSTNLR